MDIPAIGKRFSTAKVLVFGNLQGNQISLRRILTYADSNGISSVVSLGRFHDDCCSGTVDLSQYIAMHRQLADWREAQPDRTWVGMFSHYDYLPTEARFMAEFMTRDGTIKTALATLQLGNLYFAHLSDWCESEFAAAIAVPDPAAPTVMFFAHSEYMGFNLGNAPSSRRGPFLDFSRIAQAASAGQNELKIEGTLEDGKVYWVSTGPNAPDPGLDYSCFAVYDPQSKGLTLTALSALP